MPWYPVVAERDHEIQNPTSAEKIRLLGEWLQLGPECRVLDIACGSGGPALVLASAFGCHITGIERAPEFAAAARERLSAAGLGDLVEIVESDAREYSITDGAWDVALCLGATFVWDGLEGTLAALVPAVAPRGRLAIGEPYWRSQPPAGTDEMGYASLSETVRRLQTGGVTTTGMIAASRDDWDRYESLHWQAAEEWLAQHPDHPEAADLRRENNEHKERYLSVGREHLGWAIFLGRKH